MRTGTTAVTLRGAGAAAAAVLLLLGAACDDPAPAPADEVAAAEQQPKAAPMGVAPGAAQATAEAVDHEALTEQDFQETATNRDPFRSFIRQFTAGTQVTQTRQRTVLMKRYGLDELKLVAVVTGSQTRPLAMFRDPKGLGVTVQRGDYVSKSEAKVKQILKDKVVVEMEEVADEKRTVTDRVVELHSVQQGEQLELD